MNPEIILNHHIIKFITGIRTMKKSVAAFFLTHWGRVTHICVSKLTIIGSDNGLSPDRRQAIIWTNAGLLSIGPLRVYFSENLIKIQHFLLKKMHVKMSSAKWRPSCLGLNVLKAETHMRPHVSGCPSPCRLCLYNCHHWGANKTVRACVFPPLL